MDGLECIGLLGLVVAAIVLAVIATGNDEAGIDVAGNDASGNSSEVGGVADGKARTNPLPRGSSLTHNELNLTVMDVSYSSEQNGSFAPLEADHVWAIVKLRLEAVGDPNKAYGFNTIDFRLVGDKGVIYHDWVEAPKSDMGSGEFFGGANMEANVVRQVHEEDGNLVLIFSPAFQGQRFLALESAPVSKNGAHAEVDGVSGEDAEAKEAAT